MNEEKPRENREKSLALKIFPEFESAPKIRVTECNLCGGSSFATLARHDRYGFLSKLEGCRDCGLVFLNPHMGRESYAKFYAGPYRALVGALGCPAIDSEPMRKYLDRYAADLIDFIRPHVSNARYVLDVGGSNGVVTHSVAYALNAEHVTIVEPSASELMTPGLDLGYKISRINAFAEELRDTLFGVDFDLITICQTIDHFLDIKTALKNCVNLLADSGLLFVDILDFKAVVRQEGAFYRASKLDHPFYLTEETVLNYLDQLGLYVVAVDYNRDGRHIGFLCRKSQASGVKGWFRAGSPLFAELRASIASGKRR